MKKKYALNLGRIFTLSLAEIFAAFQEMKLNFALVDLYREVVIVETENEIDTNSLQERLGGTIKIMEVVDSIGRKKILGPSRVFQDYFDIKILKNQFLANDKGKIQFGISVYPMAKSLPLRDEPKKLGLMIKKIFTDAGISSRAVLPQKQALSLPSVVVTKEHLLEKGGEINFLVGFERIYLAKTLSVQDFEGYGRRDYQRPERDMQIGMLPPKVAQIMINLAQIPSKSKGNPEEAMLDPFVGTGTVVQEAMIQNFKGIGSDISQEAIEKAEKNLLWVKNRYKLPPNRFEVFVSDVKDLKKNIPEMNYNAVVTEGTLGPSYDQTPEPNEITKNFNELEKIFLSAFQAFKEILSPGKRVVIAFPAYRKGQSYIHLPIIDKVVKIGYDIIDPIPEIVQEQYDFLEVTDRKSIVYDRKDQFVSREIFIFEVK